MQTALPTEGLERYTSHSQRARIATEAWGLNHFYCPNCDAARLENSPANTRTYDYTCGKCTTTFQLKSQSRLLRGRIVDSAYDSMMRAIREDRTPNLFAMHYSREDWRVENVILVPHFAFPFSAIEKRTPLGPSARRAGWVGCNILLSAIPEDARIPIVTNGRARPAREVREKFKKIRSLERVSPEKRGWTLDVLNVLRRMGKTEFALEEVYAHESELQTLHPNNQNVLPKIRQQLQVLRDAGLVEFLGRGEYRMR